jgi:hypothetical protein
MLHRLAKLTVVLLSLLFSSQISTFNIKSHLPEAAPKKLGVEKIGPCTAKLDDGSVIDLTSLDNPSKPRYSKRDSNIFKKLSYLSSIEPLVTRIMITSLILAHRSAVEKQSVQNQLQ